jgi:Copper amine oxidase N-terminal domain.
MKAFRQCIWAALIALSMSGWCNDSAVVGVGGVIKPMKNHPSIVLRSHVVKVKITPEYADVDCTFVLHNTGKATSVLIGFPESGGGDIVVPKMGFEYFRSYVDGKRVQVRVQEQRRESGPDGYFRWYLKRVRFGAGQTRVIRNVYRAPLGAISTGHNFFDYILTTGASWKGKIGRSDIIVELSGLEHVVDLEIRPEGYRRVGNRIVWRLENYEPKENISIMFFQHYRLYADIGEPRIVSRDALIRPQGTLMIDADWFRSIRGVRVAWDGATQRVTIADSVSGRQIVMRVGDRWAIVNGQRVRLPVAPSWYHGWGRRVVRVPLRSVVEALGGQVAFKRESATVEVQFPNRPRAENPIITPD